MHHLMTSQKINDVTKLVSWDAIGKVMLTAHGAQQDFILPGVWKKKNFILAQGQVNGYNVLIQ